MYVDSYAVYVYVYDSFPTGSTGMYISIPVVVIAAFIISAVICVIIRKNWRKGTYNRISEEHALSYY